MIMKKINSFCKVYIVLFVIAFLMKIGIISACFYFYWQLKKDSTRVKFNNNTQINIKNRTCYFLIT